MHLMLKVCIFCSVFWFPHSKPSTVKYIVLTGSYSTVHPLQLLIGLCGLFPLLPTVFYCVGSLVGFSFLMLLVFTKMRFHFYLRSNVAFVNTSRTYRTTAFGKSFVVPCDKVSWRFDPIFNPFFDCGVCSGRFHTSFVAK